jgi:predicted short-subunit dehydrogenase-like oxidoreductase (DUF2520 family)
MKFSIYGNGNVAHHFSIMLKAKGHELLQVMARNPEKCALFAAQHGCQSIASAREFSSENDMILIAVKDDAIQEVSSQIGPEFFCIHPSGATPIDILSQRRKGVAWSIQSLSKSKPVDYSAIPFLIEASDADDLELLRSTLSEISHEVYITNSKARAHAHIAIVFSNNFANQLMDIAGGILEENNLPASLILPSAKEMVEKLKTMSPSEAQSGPASRADMNTIAKQIELLKGNEELSSIYKIFTNRILRHFHGKEL